MSASKTEPQTPILVVGEPCPCCGQKVRGPKLTEAEKREKRREYQNRPEVKERQKAYRAKRNAELAELRRIKAELDAQAADDE